METLPKVVQVSPSVDLFLSSKFHLTYFGRCWKSSHGKTRTHLLEWEKPLLYLSNDKKAHPSVPWGSSRLSPGRVCFDRFHLQTTTPNKATLCYLSCFLFKKFLMPWNGKIKGTPFLWGQEGLSLLVVLCLWAVLRWAWLFATPWTVAHQAPLSMEFSRQEYWSGLPFPSPGDLPDLGIKLMSPVSPALAGVSSALSHHGSLLAELKARPGKRFLTVLLRINAHFRSRDFSYEYWNVSQPR